jgi:hypothetical protein
MGGLAWLRRVGMAKAGKKSKARFLVDLTDLNISEDLQRTIATAIQAAVLQILATRLDTARPYIELARKPGSRGWAGALVGGSEEAIKELRSEYPDYVARERP